MSHHTFNLDDYRSIFENSIEGIFRTSIDGKPIAVNPAIVKMLGYTSAKELLSKITNVSQQVYVHANDRKKFLHILETQDSVSNFETQFYCKDRSIVWVSVNARAVRNGKGDIIFTEGMVQDITDKKNAEEEMVQLLMEQIAHTETEKSRQRIADILESITDAFVALDKNLRLTYTNKKAEQFLGKKREELMGKYLWEHFPHLRKVTIQKNLKRIIRQQITERYERFFDSFNAWLEIDIYPQKEGLSIYFRDITQRKKLESDLKKSEETFRLLVENAKDFALFMLDKNGLFASWNQGAERLFGYTEKEIIGQKYSLIYSPEDSKNKKPLKLLKKAGIDGHAEDEGWTRRKDGWYFWANPVIRPLKDNKNKLRGYVVITRDMTERKRIEEMILFQKTLLEAQSEASPDGILIVDSSGKILSFNQRFIKLWNIPEIVMNRRSREAVLEAILPQLTNPQEYKYNSDQLFQNSEQISTSEITLNDGRIFEIYSSPIRSTTGIYYGRIWFYRDITERKLQEKQREFLVGIVSHELKTPLTTLNAFNQLLQKHLKKTRDMEATYHTQRMAEQLGRLTDLVRDLLDVTKLRSGKLIFTKERFDINKLIATLVDDVHKTNHKSQIVVKGYASKKIIADKIRIGQAISNLISNAIKYSPKSGKIIIKIKETGKNIKISIQDFGIGIPFEKQKMVFDPFFRVSDESRDTFPGLGLGLFITSEVIKWHSGKISLKSTEGKGSTFSFVLPAGLKG